MGDLGFQLLASTYFGFERNMFPVSFVEVDLGLVQPGQQDFGCIVGHELERRLSAKIAIDKD